MPAAKPFRRLLLLLVSALAVGAAPRSLPAQEEAPARVPAGEVRGRVLAADGGAVAGAWVHVRAGTFADSAALGAAGDFAVRLPAGHAGDTVEVRVEPGDSLAARYNPSLGRVGRAEAAEREQGFVLVPRAWTIPGGRYAGRQVPVSLERAFTRACAQCSAFYLRFAGAGADSARRSVRGWPERAFPLRVAFDRDNSASFISRRDSAAFWRIAEGVEQAFGEELFRPAPYAATVAPDGQDAPEDVVLVWIEPSLPYSGLGTTGGTTAEITFGSLWLQRASQIGSLDGPQIVGHELVHTLGFGHTCQWRSVLADISRCPGMQSANPTEHDVAYVQLFRRVRDLQREHRARFGLEAALAALQTGREPLPPVPTPETTVALEGDSTATADSVRIVPPDSAALPPGSTALPPGSARTQPKR